MLTEWPFYDKKGERRLRSTGRFVLPAFSKWKIPRKKRDILIAVCCTQRTDDWLFADAHEGSEIACPPDEWRICFGTVKPRGCYKGKATHGPTHVSHTPIDFLSFSLLCSLHFYSISPSPPCTHILRLFLCACCREPTCIAETNALDWRSGQPIPKTNAVPNVLTRDNATATLSRGTTRPDPSPEPEPEPEAATDTATRDLDAALKEEGMSPLPLKDGEREGEKLVP